MGSLLLSPLVTFAVALLVSTLIYWGLGFLTYKPRASEKASEKPYACGEESNVMVRPDYSQVFPFAFYFTVLHVVALMATTAPSIGSESLVIAIIYVLGAVVGMSVLYRR